MTESSYPHRMGRVLLQATEEVLGEEELASVLGIASSSMEACGGYPLPPSSVSGISAHLAANDVPVDHLTAGHFLTSLEQIYGPQSGRGLALRIGRACFPYALREFGTSLGLTGMAFRLLPFPAKLKTFADALADLLHAHTNQHITVERVNGKLLWHVDGCVLCSDRNAGVSSCQLSVGLAEEALYWLSGGKIFLVEETACIALGDRRCTLQIDEVPIS